MFRAFEKIFDKIERKIDNCVNNSYINYSSTSISGDNSINVQIGEISTNGTNIKIVNDEVIVDGKVICKNVKVPEIVINGNVRAVDGTQITINGNVEGSIDGTNIKVIGNVNGDIDGTHITIEGSHEGDIEGTQVTIKKK